MSTAKQLIIDNLSDISDGIQDEFEVMENLYKLLRFKKSQQSITEYGGASKLSRQFCGIIYFMNNNIVTTNLVHDSIILVVQFTHIRITNPFCRSSFFSFAFIT